MMRHLTIVVARFLISVVFLAGATNKILHWHETEKAVLSVLCEWQSYLGFSDLAQNCMGALTPWTPLILIVATLFELVGGLLLLLGFKEKLGAWLLILFLIPVTIIMHQFWFVESSEVEMQMTNFLKNMAILGALLMILLHGAQGGRSSPSIHLG